MVTGFGSIVVSLCGIGVLIGGIEGNYPITGVILCVIVLAGCQALVVTLVDRRWPAPSARTAVRGKYRDWLQALEPNWDLRAGGNVRLRSSNLPGNGSRGVAPRSARSAAGGQAPDAGKRK